MVSRLVVGEYFPIRVKSGGAGLGVVPLLTAGSVPPVVEFDWGPQSNPFSRSMQ